MKQDFKALIFPPFTMKQYSFEDTKKLILNAFLVIIGAITLILIPANLLYNTHKTLFVYIDIAMFLCVVYALYQLRKNARYTYAAMLGSMMLFVTFTLIVVFLKGKDYSLVWTFFYAPFTVITLGSKRGFLLSVLFLFALLLYVSTGIDTWLNGTWNTLSYLRFSLAHIAMLYVMYTIVKSNEQADDDIQELRNKEEAQRKVLEELTVTDPLTSLYNRRFLKEVFPKEFQLAKQNQKNIAYLLLDIDYFKPFNDTYGHHKGDEILTQIAKLLKLYFPYSFRIGGDEFAAIIVSQNQESLKEEIDALMDDISKLKIPNEKSPVAPYVTCSIGVHLIYSKEFLFEKIYQQTDTALYKAKEQGRNRVVYL